MGSTLCNCCTDILFINSIELSKEKEESLIVEDKKGIEKLGYFVGFNEG